MKRKSMTVAAALLMGSAGFAQAGEKFSFGVISDTQQTVSGGTNSVATNIIAAVNQRFIAAGVDLVIQPGDLGDNGSTASLQSRLDANADLTAAGIEFYGLRGNHEAGGSAQTFFMNNYIPSSNANLSVSVASFDNTTYAITYKDTKFVMLDINTSTSSSLMASANTWMAGELSADDHTQAFVFQHKNLLGQNHKDNQFGSSNDANTANQNAYFAALADNNVKYAISGHDHMNHRAVVTSPDGQNTVQQIITQSDSTKFYSASSGFSNRETSISDQQGKIGYYIFTVDGPRVTGQYWATDHKGSNPTSDGDIVANPVWVLQDTFGYSLNGKQFTIARGASYTSVTDSISAGNGFAGTTMAIINGVNSITATAEGNRPCADDLNTGWTERETGLASDILTLWGMNDALGSPRTDPFVLSMSFNSSVDPATGEIYLVTRNAAGEWVNAVDANFGGTPLFVLGAYNSTYGLGTYGVDPLTHTAWAVVNHNSEFAAVPEPATLGLLAIGGLAMLRRRNHNQ